MTLIIEAQRLSKQFAPEQPPAVKDFSLSIVAGEIFSLLGPNGAGKTTTISMLCGLLKPTGGTALIDGHDIAADALAAKQAIGLIPQDIALYPTLSARQNLRFWGEMYGLTGKMLTERVAEVLEKIGLTDRANDKIQTYSGGMKRRVNIGAGLLHKPKIVFMDEPTVGIDPQSRRAILDMTQQLNAEGMAVLYTTHYMEEAQELSHRIGIMDNGELIALGTLDELTETVGQADTVILEINEGIEGIAKTLATLPGVRQAVRKEAEITLLVDDANHQLPDIITTVTATGAHIASIDIQEPNLEAVFLHLTGKALRD